MSKMDLTALRIRDQLYAVDKGAGQPWSGTVADIVELTGSDKRRVPDAIFQLMDDGCPIEYSRGVITFNGVTASATAAASCVRVETADVLSYADLADRARRCATNRRQEREAALLRAGQLTFDDMDLPDLPAPTPTPQRIPERLPTMATAALRVKPARSSNGATEQPSNRCSVAPLLGCVPKSRVGALLGRIADRLANPDYISTRTPTHACTDAPAFSKNNNINLNQSIQSLNSNNNQETEIQPEIAREVEKVIAGPRFFERPDLDVFAETSEELKAKFPDLCKRLREQLAYMRAWGGLSPDEYHGLIDDALKKARSPCAWLNSKITEWLPVKKWNPKWRAGNE